MGSEKVKWRAEAKTALDRQEGSDHTCVEGKASDEQRGDKASAAFDGQEASGHTQATSHGATRFKIPQSRRGAKCSTSRVPKIAGREEGAAIGDQSQEAQAAAAPTGP